MRELGLDTIAAIVRTDLEDDGAARRASVLQNTQRKTYSDIDRALVAMAFDDAKEAASVLWLTTKQVANVKSLLDLPKAVQTAIDDPDNGFTATHGVTLRQMVNKYGLNARKMGRWVKDVVA